MNGNQPVLPAWKLFFAMLLTPQKALQQQGRVSRGLAFGISAAAFVLLFLQTGLDLERAGKIESARIGILAGWGLALGTAGVALIGSLAWMGARFFGNTPDWGATLTQFGLAYSPSLLYGIFGLAFNLIFHWNTALAFGVTGLLWALAPVSAVIRNLTNERIIPAVLMTTGCGALMMAGWAYLGGVL